MPYIDTRDLYKRQCELQEELADLEMELDDAKEELQNSEEELDSHYMAIDDAQKLLDEWKEENQEELDALNELESEIGSEWMHGETMIPEDEFEDYAITFAEDVVGMDRDQPWPFTHIDWKAAAEDLAQDYTTVTWEGTDYYVRMS